MLFLGLISSDSALCHALGEQLAEAGDWQLAVFSSLAEALDVWQETFPPLIFWDAQSAPPQADQAALLATRLAAATPAPLLLLLGDGPEALDTFSIAETFKRPLRLGAFLARLPFYQRVLQQSPDTEIALGPWLFAPRRRLLRRAASADAVVKLTDKEAALLFYLCAAGKPVSRENLLAEIWGYGDGIDTHTLETHIYRLRRKLSAESETGLDPFVSEAGGYGLNPAWRSL